LLQRRWLGGRVFGHWKQRFGQLQKCVSAPWFGADQIGDQGRDIARVTVPASFNLLNHCRQQFDGRFAATGVTVLSRPSKTIDGHVTGNLLREPTAEVARVASKCVGEIFAEEFQRRSECWDGTLDLAKDAKCIVADKSPVDQPERINSLLDGRNKALN